MKSKKKAIKKPYIATYLSEIRKNLANENATEHTHRPALKALLEAADKSIIATNEPKRILCGSPDFQITRKSVPLGHVETKDIGTNLNEMERGKGPHGEQFTRYRDGLPNWILTDYIQFRWIVNGEKQLTATLMELDAKGKLKLLPDGEKKLAQLLTAFFTKKTLTIGNARELAVRLAAMTRIIRDMIVNTFNHEKEQGWLHNWLAAFRETLIPDLDEKQFADMFAQTLAYGLFAARVHMPPNKDFSREMAAYNLPKTNPFLRKLFAEIAGVDMPDSIAWAVHDIVELLKHADMFEILKDFGKGRGKEDPVVHFYETFLASYDPKMREVRGVYYTPESVVSYIVRSIDHLLKTRFNRAKGLADENTLILDPATGTATFLYFVIAKIHQKFAKQAGAWDDYVANHLLNRIFGFELLMAPYAVAHLKLGMQLQETGYQFGSEQRLGIYLTNTLEEAAKKSEQLFAGWVAEEANSAAAIKKDLPIMVVLGNPPYERDSQNKGAHIEKLIARYKAAVRKEGNLQPLNDDYIKFICFSHDRIERTGYGIIGIISNNKYLSGSTIHRGMRAELCKTFSEIYILNLYGDVGDPTDRNVFDIRKGVTIALFVKSPTQVFEKKIYYAELKGSRDSKYEYLLANDVSSTEWQRLSGKPPQFFFVPFDDSAQDEFDQGIPLGLVFGTDCSKDKGKLWGNGVKTNRDELLVADTNMELVKRIEVLENKEISDGEARERLGIVDGKYWNTSRERTKIRQADWKSRIVPYCYRPFRKRWILYQPNLIEIGRGGASKNVMKQMLKPNYGLITHRTASKRMDYSHFFVTDVIMDVRTFPDREGVPYIFPLYIYESDPEEKQRNLVPIGIRRPNFSLTFLKLLAEKLKLPQEDPHGLPQGIEPEEIFQYAYAIFYSPQYRTRYAEFLKIDFPRLPLTRDAQLFKALADKGSKLVELHLMKSPKLNNFVTEFPEKGDNIAEKVRYSENESRIWINKTQYFNGVSREVWQFQIGGYQVCDRWLKDHKDRKLTYDDIMHYQKIIVALNETIRLMLEIDKCIPSWPLT